MTDYNVSIQQPRQFGAQVDFKLSPAVEDLTNLNTSDVDKTAGATDRYVVFYDADQKEYSLKPETYRTINFLIDGGYNSISVGSKGYLTLDFNGKITAWTLLSEQVGDITIDVKKASFNDYPITTSITGTQIPILSSAQKNKNTNLTTWNTSLISGDILEFFVSGTPTLKKVMLSLTVKILT